MLFRSPASLLDYRTCEAQGHYYEPRFDDVPTLKLDPDDLVKFRSYVEQTFGDHPQIKNADGTPLRVAVTGSTYHAAIAPEQLEKLIRASIHRTYIGDCCRYCGDFKSRPTVVSLQKATS